MSNTNSPYSGSYPGSQYGTVFTTPSLSDLSKSFKYVPSFNSSPTAAESQAVVPAGDPYSQRVKDQLDYEKGYFPIWQQMQQSSAKAAADTTRQQMSDLFPYLSAASAEATARNLAASTQFLLNKEQTPTAQALRNQIAQSQMTSAAGAEAERDRATATQAMAAKEFARGYAGTTFRTA
jgi:hypothetical protein